MPKALKTQFPISNYNNTIAAPYAAFASVYAEAMADIPYAGWFAFIRGHMPAPAGHPIIDLFSGPGRLTELARSVGYKTIALDRHFAFLKNQGDAALMADASALPLRAACADGLFAANSSLNYLADTNQLKVHLHECHRVLVSGGIYVFDVCPEARAVALSGKQFNTPDSKIRFAHRYQSAEKILETQVTVFTGKEIATEMHRQYIFSDAQLLSAAQRAGFTLKAKVANYGLKNPGSLPSIMTWVLIRGVNHGHIAAQQQQ